MKTLYKRILDILQDQQDSEGAFRDHELGNKELNNLISHKLIYTSQVVRFLGSVGFDEGNDVFRKSLNFIKNAPFQDRVFYDYTLRCLPLLETLHIKSALELVSGILSIIDENGFIDYFVRQEGQFFDYLVTLEILLLASKFQNDEILKFKTEQVYKVLRNLTNNNYYLGNNPANWVWYMRILLQKKEIFSTYDYATLFNRLLDKLHYKGYWIHPNPPSQSITPKIYNNDTSGAHLVNTCHVLINLSYIWKKSSIDSPELEQIILRSFNFVINAIEKPDVMYDAYKISLIMRTLATFSLNYGKNSFIDNSIKKIFGSEIIKVINTQKVFYSILFEENPPEIITALDGKEKIKIQWQIPIIPKILQLAVEDEILIDDFNPPFILKIIKSIQNLLGLKNNGGK